MKPLPLFLTALAVAASLVPTLRAQEAAISPAASPTPSPAPVSEVARAYFAGGCFWCMQYAFDRVPGVKKTIVGYTGGKVAAPDYEEVSTGTTGHAESIEVQFDPKEVTYDHLLEVFFKNIDPTTLNREFADSGTQYRTAIFYGDDTQKQTAEATVAALGKSGKYHGKPIVTQIVPLAKFYPAEEYHQEYYKKNPAHFQSYEVGSGRAGYIERMSGTDAPK